MPLELFIDTDARRLVQSDASTAPLGRLNLWRGDTDTLRLFFLKRTGLASPVYTYLDKNTPTAKASIGIIGAQPTSGAWTLDGNSLPFNATAADVQTALRTSQSDNALTVVGSMLQGFTVTWGVDGAEDLLVGDVSQLLPHCTLSVEERRAGGVSTREQQFLKVRVNAGAEQTSFSNLTTAVSATITEVQSGSATVNEIQRVAFSVIPASGDFTLTFPADTRNITAAVVAGVFTTTTNHGFVVGQPVQFASLSNPANVANGVKYYVHSIPSSLTFMVSAAPGGSAITNATSDAASATVVTFGERTEPLKHDATPAQVQTALQALKSIGAGGCAVTGVPKEFFQIQFAGGKGLAALPAFTADFGGLLGRYGKTGSLALTGFQLRDLLGGEAAKEMTLEIELTNSGAKETYAAHPVLITRDLIL